MESDEAFINIRAGNYSYEDIVKKGEFFEYRSSINSRILVKKCYDLQGKGIRNDPGNSNLT